MSKLRLVIGNKNYSSWSLRAWLYLELSGVSFEEERIALFRGDFRERIARYSPAGRVPVLVELPEGEGGGGDVDGDDAPICVWDSWAIIEHVRERFEGMALDWPRAPAARAEARAIAAEMHAGFGALRQQMPFNVRARRKIDPRGDAALWRDVERVREIVVGCRERHLHQGRWLYGDLSIADVMYAPVALRLLSYQVELRGVLADWVHAINLLPAVARWVAAAEAEREQIPEIDELRADALVSLG
ncbi:MAG: glutathione S-transferase N-terminal domain-containing protein [Myxococcales bacterium]|nr:glutathione S-transferase N-terminal domain-containing protein [Myxococcales bacterium]